MNSVSSVIAKASRQWQLVGTVLVCAAVFAVYIHLIEPRPRGNLSWAAQSPTVPSTTTAGETPADAILRKCPVYRELRSWDFLDPALRHRLCAGAEAYKQYPAAGGFPVCQLQNPFDADLLDSVRLGSEAVKLDCANETSVQLYVYKDNDLISNGIRANGSWEPKLVDWTLRFALKVPRATFVDIGSSLGVYSIQAAKLGLPVVAVNANIRNLLRLHLSLKAASLGAALVWNFISPDQRLRYLSFPATCNVGGVSGMQASGLPDTIPVMPIGSERIAGLVNTKNIVMKLGIEGGEIDFLRTSGRLFTDFTVAAVQMEWNPTLMQDTDEAFLSNFFTSRGYKLWQLPALMPLDSGDTKSWLIFTRIVWIHMDFFSLV